MKFAMETASIKQILLTTDFSDSSRSAYVTAASWARKVDARLHLVHVADSPGTHFSQHPWEACLRELGGALVKESQCEAFEGLHIIPQLLEARAPFEALKKYTRDADIDLAVNASHGRTGLDRFLLGSFAERLVRTSTVPVLTTRNPPASGVAPGNVLVPFDFSDCARGVLPMVYWLAERFESRFHFLYVDEPLPEHLPFYERLRAALKDAPQTPDESFGAFRQEALQGIEVEFESTSGTPHIEIARRAGETRADLVLLATHGILGAVAQNLPREVHCSVLSTPFESVDA
jgi:nucleotide-binding universal stress UspA family protein